MPVAARYYCHCAAHCHVVMMLHHPSHMSPPDCSGLSIHDPRTAIASTHEMLAPLLSDQGHQNLNDIHCCSSGKQYLPLRDCILYSQHHRAAAAAVSHCLMEIPRESQRMTSERLCGHRDLFQHSLAIAQGRNHRRHAVTSAPLQRMQELICKACIQW